ncbi:Ion channel [Seminavis robusta]|uniref:Ion channel n=1 Tax=Seminavis robusta TaxID=568900 RepID=A0A9N8H2M0_9STRA|nr:Ion channel [Seminavis robusta]|eukprot:Sro68_g038100.1 Ion channel (543) ;mRNA; r:56060-57843
MDDRSSAFSGSTGTDGYETPDEEESPTSKTVRFATELVEQDNPLDPDVVNDSQIDKKRCRLMRRVFHRYPRCYAFWIGMVFPLWFLVFLSLLGGKLLGDFEFGNEVAANNEAMRNQLLEKTYGQVVSDSVVYSPRACYTLYRQRIAVENLTNFWAFIYDQDESLPDFLNGTESNFDEDDVISLNITDFINYLGECGKVADNFTDTVQDTFFGDLDVSVAGSTSLTFSWSRCVNDSVPGSYNNVFHPSLSQIYAVHPNNQSATFQSVWNEEQQRLEDEYLQQYRADNTSNAGLKAFNDSIFDASAKHTCAINIPATAWFWFTVMTTVGYGNQAPSTLGGRILIFTFGSFSILMFGGVLAASGVITSLFVNDFAIRLRLRLLANKFVMIVVWGLLWIGWMTYMASQAIYWRKWRLLEEMSWEEALWFAFISTTTVGLGDFYPNPEVMFISDLLFFSLSFLFGFVLISAFLTEMTLVYYSPDLSEELAKRLKYVGVLPCKGWLHGQRSDFDESRTHEDADQLSNQGTPAKEPDIPGLPEQPSEIP